MKPVASNPHSLVWQDPEKMALDALAHKVAAMAIAQISIRDMMKELENEGIKLTYHKTRKILHSDECKKVMRSFTEETLDVARHVLRNRMASLAGKIADVVEKHLDEGNLNAVPHAVKILGIVEDVKPEPTTSLTVVLPATPKKVEDITITGERNVTEE